jgi:hypothetical protein
MRSLLLVESFDLRPSNQYILVRVIPSCFPSAKMCLCQVSLLSRCSPGRCTNELQTEWKEDIVTLVPNFMSIHPAVLMLCIMQLNGQTERKLQQRFKFPERTYQDWKPQNCRTLLWGRVLQVIFSGPSPSEEANHRACAVRSSVVLDSLGGVRTHPCLRNRHTVKMCSVASSSDWCVLQTGNTVVACRAIEPEVSGSGPCNEHKRGDVGRGLPKEAGSVCLQPHV